MLHWRSHATHEALVSSRSLGPCDGWRTALARCPVRAMRRREDTKHVWSGCEEKAPGKSCRRVVLTGGQVPGAGQAGATPHESGIWSLAQHRAAPSACRAARTASPCRLGGHPSQGAPKASEPRLGCNALVRAGAATPLRANAGPRLPARPGRDRLQEGGLLSVQGSADAGGAPHPAARAGTRSSLPKRRTPAGAHPATGQVRAGHFAPACRPGPSAGRKKLPRALTRDAALEEQQNNF